MLVLTRKPKETIHIGDGITVTLVRVRGQMVRLGIEAPRDVRIVRGELRVAEPTSPGVRDCTARTVRCPAVRDEGLERGPRETNRSVHRTSLRALAARKLAQGNQVCAH